MNQNPGYLTSPGLTVFEQIANRDRTALEDCIDAYGGFIWALAKKCTVSLAEAEAATLEIFQDICRYSKHAAKSRTPEKDLIALIARRRLSSYSTLTTIE